jgi:hypothetical protein
MLRRIVVLVSAATLAAIPGHAFFERPDTAALVSAADVIVVGTVDQVTGRRVGDRAQSVNQLSVDTLVKGTALPVIDVVTEGGTTPTVSTFVEDEAPLAAGMRTVLFLAGPDGSGSFRVVAGAPGAAQVVEDQVPANETSLADFLAEIRVICGSACP